MTTSSKWLLAVLLVLVTSLAGAQTEPKELIWALGEFEGQGEWKSRLPQLLVRGWNTLPGHRVTSAESSAFRQKFLESSRRALQQQASRLMLDLDKKRLTSVLSISEKDGAEKTLKGIESKLLLLEQEPIPEPAFAPLLPLKAAWAQGREGLPWIHRDRSDLLKLSRAHYLVTGEFRSVAGYLQARIEFYSTLEERVLARWEGSFAADEADERMTEASGAFRSSLLGRAWAGLVIQSPVSGTRVQIGGLWHPLPWATDVAEPGELSFVIQSPAKPERTMTVVLDEGKQKLITLESGESAAEPLVLETLPSGAELYLDSRYLGPSPQTIDRPLATSRVRAQIPGMETLVWEIGPDTASPSLGVLVLPVIRRPVLEAKDRFYWTVAAFGASLASASFTAAWTEEQWNLVNLYALGGNRKTYDHAAALYYGGAVGYTATVLLTSGVFVWMMFELGDYLGVAQASLP